MNEINAESQAIRAAEYLFNKYCKMEVSLPRQRKTVRDNITQEEHDKILRLYDQQNITITELAKRFSRSIGVVSMIVNRKHSLYSAPTNQPPPK